MLQSYKSIMLLAIFLLILSQVSSRVFEKPLIPYNKSMIMDNFGISNQNSTFNNTATIEDISSPRAINPSTIFVKNGLSPVHKINSYILKGGNKNPINQRMPWTLNIKTRNKDTTVGNLALNDILLSKQSSTRPKYPNHSAVYRSINNNHDKREFFSNEVDYEHQSQDYDSEYYTDGYYNSISKEQGDYNNKNHNVEDTGIDPWRVPYSLPNMEYFLPPTPINSFDKKHPVVTMARECNCPQSSTRSYDCQNPSSNFINLLYALGQNIWALIRFIIAGSAPLIIPFIILKLIIIPLKILKIISLIKFFLKFFIVLPLLLRVILPILFNFFSSPNFLLQNILGTPLTYSDPRQSDSHYLDIDSDSFNSTSTISLKNENYLNNEYLWDLRTCPDRISCELGVLISTPGDTYFLQKIALYLLKNNNWITNKNYNNENANREKSTNDENKEYQIRRDELLKIFLVALSKRWTKDKCEIYNCLILF